MKKIIVFIFFFFIIQTVGAGLICTYDSDESLRFNYSNNYVKAIQNTPCKILFIGSSYFNFNNLPDLFEQIVVSSGKEVYVDHHGRNGMYLDDHAQSSETESKIFEQDWDYIVLQGVGTNTAYPDYFTDHPVYPALVTLQEMILENCEFTKMIYCMPWAFEDGMTWYQDWTDTYEDMQIKIFETVVNYSNCLGFQIAPVGWAWYAVLEDLDYPLHYLYLSDWNHPSQRGSYLMACVIFSSIYLESVVDNSYYDGLLEEEAKYFQHAASEVVFENLSLWNLGDEIENNPPEKPLKPIGPVQIKPGISYSYSSMTTDLNEDMIYYLFDWGDDNVSDWIGPFQSGEKVSVNYTWEKKGSYDIRVKAKDEHSYYSSWSDSLQVNLSKYNLLQFSFFENALLKLYLILNGFNDFFGLFFCN